MSKSDFPIDVVILWVDGDDPVHRAKRLRYMGLGDEQRDDVAATTRFKDVGEVVYCVASVLRNMPYVRQIFIVTDQQQPQLEPMLSRNFPLRIQPITIIDHKTIFEGYEEYLPTFNSLSIESMLWRIPGLAEHFVYLNDDMLVLSPTTPETFFTPEGEPVCYAKPMLTLWAELLRAIKPRKGGHKPFGFKDSMLNAQRVAGRGLWFPCMAHTPYVLRRSFFEEFFSRRPEALVDNIKYRFRDAGQYNPQELFYLCSLREGRGVRRTTSGTLLYLKPKPKEGYVAGKLAKFERNHTALFGCINSLDQASPEEQQMVKRWLAGRLGIEV